MLETISREAEMSVQLAHMKAPDPDDVALGKRIKEARLAAGVKQAKLARKLGVTPVTVYRWETGEVSVSVERLRQIAQEIKTPIEELVPELEEQESEPAPDDPEQLIRLAQLALAAARAPDDKAAKDELNEAIKLRNKRLRAG